MNRSQKGEPGPGLVEYSLLLVLILVIVVIGLVLIGPSLEGIFSAVMETLDPPG